MEVEFIMPLDLHKQIVQAAFEKRGFTEKESSQAADFSEQASWHGIKTHNALKALHLDHLFGSAVGGCVPGAEVEVLSTSFVTAFTFSATVGLVFGMWPAKRAAGLNPIDALRYE